MEICFREIDPFNCWIWLRFAEIPSDGEKNYIDGIFDSWYVIGRLGGFNAENLQAHQNASDLSWMAYDNNEAESALPAVMHNLGHLEYQGDWARCWVDLGTTDGVAIDVLINSLLQINEEVVNLTQLLIGGINDDWPVESHPDALFQD
tara:strand:+ start:60 stop:503 length:444 start_codon:yes stop_codon:yes gene_type:complete